MNKIRYWCFYTKGGAVSLGLVCGVLIALLAIVAASSANANQSKTLTLDEDYVQGNTRICVYSDAARVETVEIRKSQHCKSVLTVVADE